VLERAADAKARGARAIARWLGTFAVAADASWPCAPPRHPSRTLVVTTTLTREQVAAFERTSWATCPRRSIAAASGQHEAASGVALAVAVAALGETELDETLVLNGTPSALWVTHFARPERQA
jgi:hypothetical protein